MYQPSFVSGAERNCGFVVVVRGTEVALELSTGRRPLLGYNWQQAAALQPTPMRSVSATRFVIDDAVPMTLRVLGWRPYVLRGIWCAYMPNAACLFSDCMSPLYGKKYYLSAPA